MQRHFLAVEDFLAPAPRHRDEVAEHVAFQTARVLHAHHGQRDEVLVDARGCKGVGSADFAPVLAYRFRALRTIDAETGGERLRVRKHMIADPGEREIGDNLFVGTELVEQIAVDRRDDEIVEIEHYALGPPGRAGGVEHDGEVLAFARRHGSLSTIESNLSTCSWSSTTAIVTSA